MEYKEMKAKAEELKEAMKSENGGNADQYVDHEEMERRSNWHMLYLALARFCEEE